MHTVMRLATASTLLLCVILAGCAKKPAPTPAKPSSPVEQVVVGIPNKPVPRVRNIQFAFDSDTVSKRDASRILRDCLNYPGQKVLTGYASNDRSGKYAEKASKAYNLALAARRAQAVRLVYTVSGCPDARVEAFGETDRFNKKRPEINRRVTVK